MPPVRSIAYVTSSSEKKEEAAVIERCCKLSSHVAVSDVFHFEIRELAIPEVLEVDLKTMVEAEVLAAYAQLKVPCIVEHAGLIFDDYIDQSYPGGLTKAMWNALGNDFVSETQSGGRRAIARAVVGYCDGQQITTFTGETNGSIAQEPQGSRPFYWDTVFVPDNEETAGMTYAQIVDDSNFGLEYKVTRLSQSTKAMLAFLEYALDNSPVLWSRTRETRLSPHALNDYT